MEAIGFVLALVAFAALSLRFGQDSRTGFRSKEQDLASCGMRWDDLDPAGHPGSPLASPTAAPPAPVARDEATPGRPTRTHAHPTLALIERALGDSRGALTRAPDADRLEVRARDLVADYWSDAVWATGIVPAAAFRRVLAELAPGLVAAAVRDDLRAEVVTFVALADWVPPSATAA